MSDTALVEPFSQRVIELKFERDSDYKDLGNFTSIQIATINDNDLIGKPDNYSPVIYIKFFKTGVYVPFTHGTYHEIKGHEIWIKHDATVKADGTEAILHIGRSEGGHRYVSNRQPALESVGEVVNIKNIERLQFNGPIKLDSLGANPSIKTLRSEIYQTIVGSPVSTMYNTPPLKRGYLLWMSLSTFFFNTVEGSSSCKSQRIVSGVNSIFEFPYESTSSSDPSHTEQNIYVPELVEEVFMDETAGVAAHYVHVNSVSSGGYIRSVCNCEILEVDMP